jgi:hypothetical protein
LQRELLDKADDLARLDVIDKAPKDFHDTCEAVRK